MSEPTSLDYALALLQRGLSIVPVPRPGGDSDGKRPRISWKPYQTERPSDAQVREWFAHDQNIAIITGAVSGVVVVDTDSPEAEEWARLRLPRTPWRVTTAKGVHRYYRHTGVPVSNRARIVTRDGRLALDVRGDGGFVIGPGSIHASGVVYLARGDWSVQTSKLPAFWLGWVVTPRPILPPRPNGVVRRFTGDAATRARAYLRALPAPVIGQGSDEATFYAACRLVRGFALDDATSIGLLMEWSGFERSWIEAKVASAVKYGDEEHGHFLREAQ